MSVYKKYNGSHDYLVEFDQRHGGIAVLWNGNLIYPDGAYRSGQCYVDGPSDPLDILKCHVRYYEIALENASNAFTYFKRNTAMHNFHDEEVVATLKELRREVLSTRKALRKAEDEVIKEIYGVDSTEEARSLQAESDRRNAEYEEQQASEEAKARSRILSIRI